MRALRLVTGIVSEKTLFNFAQGLASEHTPILMNYEAKFGLSSISGCLSSASLPLADFAVVASEAAKDEIVALPQIRQTSDAGKGEGRDVCATCGTGVDAKVRWFCQRNKARFGGKILCRQCQPGANGQKLQDNRCVLARCVDRLPLMKCQASKDPDGAKRHRPAQFFRRDQDGFLSLSPFQEKGRMNLTRVFSPYSRRGVKGMSAVMLLSKESSSH